MKTELTSRSIPTLLPILASLLFACGSTPDEGDGFAGPPGSGPNRPPGPERVVFEPPPWTDSFRQSAILVADEIRIEGPEGLLDHVATRIEPEHHNYQAETIAEGFQQVFEPRDPTAGVELRAYLDAYQVVAAKRLVLLERTGDVQVIIQAVGDAYWRDLTSGAERRGSLLTFRGDPPE